MYGMHMHMCTCLATIDLATWQRSQCVQVLSEMVHYAVQWQMERDCFANVNLRDNWLPFFGARCHELLQDCLPISDVLGSSAPLRYLARVALAKPAATLTQSYELNYALDLGKNA